jgi:putative SOS response-associated peptidase YedK
MGMCAAYTPSRRDQLAAHFSVDPREHVIAPDAYPGSMAPIVRRSFDNPASGQREAVSAMFGMVPHWADLKLARQTYNSRSETTAAKPSFRNAWRQRQFCVIPVYR